MKYIVHYLHIYLAISKRVKNFNVSEVPFKVSSAAYVYLLVKNIFKILMSCHLNKNVIMNFIRFSLLTIMNFMEHTWISLGFWRNYQNLKKKRITIIITIRNIFIYCSILLSANHIRNCISLIFGEAVFSVVSHTMAVFLLDFIWTSTAKKIN